MPSQVTVEDAVYVIDPGLTKGTTYSAHTNIAALETMQISRSNVQQRRGRAGRCRPGKFYKLYSEYEFLHEMRDHEAPEMFRTQLKNSVFKHGHFDCQVTYPFKRYYRSQLTQLINLRLRMLYPYTQRMRS